MNEAVEQAAGRVVIVVPALNEVRTIGSVVARLKAEARTLAASGLLVSVFVVDDGSADGTHRAAAEGGADRVIRLPENHGLGAAVRVGLEAARDAGADVVAKMDADSQHDPADISKIIGPILDDAADIVYGDRTGGIQYDMSMLRRCGNACFTRLMRWLTGWPVRDSQPGIIAVGRRYLDCFSLPGDYNYTQQVLLDGYQKRMRFVHVAVTFHPRQGGASFVTWRYPFHVLGQILTLVTRRERV